METRHYFKTPYEIVDSKEFKELAPSTQLFYVNLCKLANNYADEDGWFYRSIKTLVQDTGMNKMTIGRAKKSLLQKNFIEVNRRYFENNKYRASDYYKINGFTFRVSK